MCAAFLLASGCCSVEVGCFLHTPLGGGHTSHCVTSTHTALDQLPTESQTRFQHRRMRGWGKGYSGSLKKTLCQLTVNSLGSNALTDTVLKGATSSLNCTTAIKELVYLWTLHNDTLCERTRHNLGSKCYFVCWCLLSKQWGRMGGSVTLTTICIKPKNLPKWMSTQ